MSESDVTHLLERLSDGDKDVVNELAPLVYGELKRRAAGMMAREAAQITLQPTALVHDAFMKLIDQSRVSWQGRSHFFAVGAQAMRRILVDHARARGREKRGGGLDRIELNEEITVSPQKNEDILALEEALEKLGQLDERQAKIVELRFYGGLNVQEVAEALGVSKRTVEAEWTMVRAWLRRELGHED